MAENKPIIIDGVDVSWCIFYQANFEEDFDVKIKHFCSNWHNSCESVNNSNCYFKQLARKTQECEELKDKIKFMEGYIKTVENARDELERENKFSKEQAEQKLEQIRDIASNYKNCNDLGFYAQNSEARYALWKVAQAMCDILQIISKVE